MRETQKYLKSNGWENEFELIVFNFDRLYDLLEAGSRIKKNDRVMLQEALQILKIIKRESL